MRISRIASIVVFGLIFTVGCGSKSALPARVVLGNAKPRIASRAVFDTKEYSHFAFLFSSKSSAIAVVDLRTNQPVAAIPNNGGFLAGDRAGDLYTAQKNRTKISVYRPGQWRSPAQILNVKPGFYFGAMHVDAQGNLWAAFSTASGETKRVGEYPRGASEPVKTLRTNYDWVTYVAVDLEGNVWTAINLGPSAVIGYWPKGNGTFKAVKIACKHAQGLVFDSAGNMLLEDGQSPQGDVVYVIPPGTTKPSRTIVIQPGYKDFWTGLTLGTAQERFLVQNSNTDTTRIINYASGKTEAYLKYGGGAAAITPASLP